MDAKLDKMAETFDARLDKLTEGFDQKLEAIATRFNRVDDNFKWLVGINLTMWATTVGALIVAAGLILSR